MTDQAVAPARLIGPLTAEEWVSLAHTGEDDDILRCCSGTSELRDAIFQVLRLGADPRYHWRAIAAHWDIVESHGGLGDDPRMRKLFAAYVEGRKRPDRQESHAHMLQQTPEQVRPFIDYIAEARIALTRQGRINTLGRVGSRWVAYVLDADEREALCSELAAKLGMKPCDVMYAVDVLRAAANLPYEATARPLRDL